MTEPQPGDYVRVDPPQGSPCSVTGAPLWGTFLHADEGSAAVMCEDGGDSAVALGELVIVPLEWLSPAIRPVHPEAALDEYMGLPMEHRGLDELKVPDAVVIVVEGLDAQGSRRRWIMHSTGTPASRLYGMLQIAARGYETR